MSACMLKTSLEFHFLYFKVLLLKTNIDANCFETKRYTLALCQQFSLTLSRKVRQFLLLAS